MKNYPVTVENLLKAKTVCFRLRRARLDVENRAGRVVKTRQTKSGPELLVQVPSASPRGFQRARWVAWTDVTCIHAVQRATTRRA